MALTNTTLAAAVLATDTKINVTSATGFADKQLIQVDGEYMVQIGDANGTYINVRRGTNGSAVAAHGILADVCTGLTSDFPDPPIGSQTLIPPFAPQMVTIGASNSTLDLTQYTGRWVVFTITKATAAAITIATGPAKTQDGVFFTFRSATAAAHTVTYTPGFYGDTTSSDVGTFAAKNGASMTVQANAGTLGVISLANVTLA